MDTTLVLDIGYQPIAVTTWQTAIVWMIDRAVEVIDEYPDRPLRSQNWTVPMPSIVRFLKPIKRKRAIKFSRTNIYARDRGRCQYCGIRVAKNEWTYDHVVPRSQGGTTRWENVVVACGGVKGCNQYKGGRTPEQAGMKLRTFPVKPKSLPENMLPMFMYRDYMPSAWKDYMRDASYWTSELEHDGE